MGPWAAWHRVKGGGWQPCVQQGVGASQTLQPKAFYDSLHPVPLLWDPRPILTAAEPFITRKTEGTMLQTLHKDYSVRGFTCKRPAAARGLPEQL